jgi:beta-xylosidase
MLVATLAMPSTAQAATSNNPVLDGSYADPDIDWFDCKFWIFPTTDGIIDERDGWWGSKTFKAFSSEDMVNWTDNGVILNVEADTAEEAGTNEYGIQIAYSPWSYGHAWAPSIEKVGDMYYFYYVAAIKDEYMEKYGAHQIDDDGNFTSQYVDDKAIGVAYSSSPTGPYTALEEPIVYPKMFEDKYGTSKSAPSVIDPSIFIDDDGTPYMTFGNWVPCIIKLNKDMISVDESSLRIVSGIPTGWWSQDAFMESLVIFKRNGKYYFTWSVDGTASENYRVAYGVASKITYNVSYKGILLQKDEANSIYGTAHQSILYLPTNDTYYISYGRLQTQADGTLSTNGDRGNYREVCIDKITFDSIGEASATPTNTGVESVTSHTISSTVKSTSKKAATMSANGKITQNYYCTECGKLFPKSTTISKISSVKLSTTSYTYDGKAKKPTVTVKDSSGKTISASNYTVKYSSNTNVGKAKAVITFKGNYSGSKDLYFTINPKSTSLSGLTAKSKGFTVKWKKQATQTTGYQIQYATDSKFTKNCKTVTISKNSTTSKTISKLSAKKKYYVRIRTYKTVSGTKYYSSWSSSKNITTKK